MVFSLSHFNLLAHVIFFPPRAQWWFVPLPFGILIFVYDEIRKLGVRRYPGSKMIYSAQVGQQDISLYMPVVTVLLFVIPQVGGIRSCTTETGEVPSSLLLSLCTAKPTVHCIDLHHTVIDICCF